MTTQNEINTQKTTAAAIEAFANQYRLTLDGITRRGKERVAIDGMKGTTADEYTYVCRRDCIILEAPLWEFEDNTTVRALQLFSHAGDLAALATERTVDDVPAIEPLPDRTRPHTLCWIVQLV